MCRLRLASVALAATMAVAASGCSQGTDAAGDSTLSTAPAPATFPIAGAVAVEPGAIADGSLVVDGVTVPYVTVVPEGFETGDTAPVLLAFPPGDQSADTTRSVAEQTYVEEATARGWVVLSPAAPVGGDRWDQESRRFVPSLLDWIDTWVEPEGGAVHVAGISNGGLSTFAAATLIPDRIRSLVAFPGFPRSDEAREALPNLVDVPVRMFVGELDQGWVGPMQSAADTLDELGGDVTLVIVADEGHVIDDLRDGERIFDELDAIRGA